MKTHMICLTVLLGAFYIVGFGIFGCSVWSAWRSTKAAGWPTTPGAITQLEIQEKSDSDGSTYKVVVTYAYAVNGTTYEGDRLAFGYAGSSERKMHDEIHQKLKDAKEVTVRYNPADPADSCLSFGLHRSIQVGFTFSLTWLAFIFGFTLLVWLLMQRDAVLLENLAVR